MPVLSKTEALEKVAQGVEAARGSDLPEIYAEIFPENTGAVPTATEIARSVREGLEAEEIVDLWNVVFPEDRQVWYDEEADSICYNEEMVGYVD